MYGARIVVVLQLGDGEPHGVHAVVDHAAARTLLPYDLAEKLGLDGSLRRGKPVKGIGSQKLRTWVPKEPILAEIGASIDGKPTFFGPTFELEPGFIKAPRSNDSEASPPSLLGRADFFKVFGVHLRGETMTLEWEE